MTMKKKFSNFALSVLAIVIPILLGFELLIHTGYGPLFTNSIGFDAKIQYIEKNKIGQTDLLAIGSSITLNDLSSDVIRDSISNISYFNFSCWGLQIRDVKPVLIHYLPRYRPKYIVICSSLNDFTNAGNTASIENYFNTGDYFKQHFKEYFYIKNYNSLLDIFIRKQELKKHSHSNGDEYASLNFDQYGAVLLNLSPQNIQSDRWNAVGGFPTAYTNEEYSELILLCKLLKERQIKLIFIQSPIRKAYINTPGTQQILNNHFNVCDTIVERYGGKYLNLHDTTVFSNDRMFVDQFHLSKYGATLFTQKAITGIKAIIRSSNSK